MKRVNISKEPSQKQMLNMAENLESLTKKSTTVEASCWKMSHDKKPCTFYRLYVADLVSEDYRTWRETQDRYFTLMKVLPRESS